jgi:hypothetical protein
VVKLGALVVPAALATFIVAGGHAPLWGVAAVSASIFEQPKRRAIARAMVPALASRGHSGQ